MENKKNVEEMKPKKTVEVADKDTQGADNVQILSYTIDDINAILETLNTIDVKGVANCQKITNIAVILHNKQVNNR